MIGGSGHVSESLIAVVLGPVCGALLVAVVVFVLVKFNASRRRRRQQRLEHGNIGPTLRQGAAAPKISALSPPRKNLTNTSLKVQS